MLPSVRVEWSVEASTARLTVHWREFFIHCQISALTVYSTTCTDVFLFMLITARVTLLTRFLCSLSNVCSYSTTCTDVYWCVFVYGYEIPLLFDWELWTVWYNAWVRIKCNYNSASISATRSTYKQIASSMVCGNSRELSVISSLTTWRNFSDAGGSASSAYCSATRRSRTLVSHKYFTVPE